MSGIQITAAVHYLRSVATSRATFAYDIAKEKQAEWLAADLIQRLSDEVERLRADALSWEEQASERTKDCETFIDQIELLSLSNEKLRPDAERYRFLRTGQNWPCAFADSDNWEPIIGTELDSVIDAAMEKR